MLDEIRRIFYRRIKLNRMPLKTNQKALKCVEVIMS